MINRLQEANRVTRLLSNDSFRGLSTPGEEDEVSGDGKPVLKGKVYPKTHFPKSNQQEETVTSDLQIRRSKDE